MAGPLPATVEELRRDPAAGLDRLARGIETYWHLALAEHWPRIRDLLEGDILHRARRIAEGGADLLFRDLHPQVEWRPDTLRVSHHPYSHARSARGLGLLLVPSAFVWPRVFTITPPPWQPTLIYPARGLATLWEQARPAGPEALARVLGPARARLLSELDAPASTTELARRTATAAGGVSRHLTALRDAGLVTPHRSGRSVLYARTAVGDALVASATRPASGRP
jgi:DNA-binding transcriptional ArsR family regulator